MEHKAYIIKVDGSIINLDHQPTLSEAQTIVGGWIESIPSVYKFQKNQIIYVDEEGLIAGKPLNQKASDLLIPPQVIVGDALILEGYKTVRTDKTKKELN